MRCFYFSLKSMVAKNDTLLKYQTHKRLKHPKGASPPPKIKLQNNTPECEPIEVIRHKMFKKIWFPSMVRIFLTQYIVSSLVRVLGFDSEGSDTNL